MKTLLIDNYDSFTFNLFQLIAEVNGEEPLVVRNDGASWSELEGWGVDNIVISPGPGRPERPTDFGVCSDAIRLATVPVLGVCLGHQGLGHLSGGTVVHAPEVMHGRLSTVYHNGSELFAGIPQGFEAVRFHSLCVLSPPPEGLEVIAWTADDLIMGLRDLHRPRWGVQFHPESISTTYGRELLENFRALTEKFGTSQKPTAASRSRTILPRRTIADRRGPIEPSLELKVRKLDHAPDPERAFVHLFGGDSHAWWLDSSKQGDERSAFSFMGGSDGPLASRAYYDVVSKEVTVVRGGLSETRKQTIFDYLQDELDRFSGLSADVPFDFNCGFVGYFGYELKADCGGSLVHRSALPDAVFQFADRLIAFDHREACTYVLCLVDSETVDGGERWLDEAAEKLAALPPLPERAPANGARSKPVDFYLSRSYETYLDDIARCKQYLIDGETYEVCLTNKVKTDIHPDPLDLYRVVRNVNPAPFSAFLRDGGSAVVCSSPERFLHIGRDRWVETKPIKGTVRRGRTPSEDASLKEALCADEKTRAENLMITDLLRNDLGVVCEIGSVHVPHLFAVESYETVHQLVSTIRGRLREDLGPVDCIRACFPGGSMTGAPKKRTLEIIDELETEARGVYSGAIGYLGLCGAVDLNIVIRTIVLDDEETSIGMGGAIVMQSDAEEEYEETILKARALMKAIVLCVNGHDELAAVEETPEKELEWALRKAITGTRSRAARGETEGRPARLATPPPTRLA